MKKFILPVFTFCLAIPTYAQVQSVASQLKAVPKADVSVPFRYTDEGVATPIEWGLDLAWLDEANIHRGVNFAGKDLIDIIRTSYRATESVEEGALSTNEITYINQRATIIKRYFGNDIALNINHDHGEAPQIDSWYNDGKASTSERGKRWAKVIDLTIKKYASQNLKNVVSISPYNEPDFGWGQGYSSSTRKNDFLNICKSLKQDFEGAYDNVRICGGNTLNDDKAYDWWNHLKAYLDEGNTHQLAGSFDNYASFFKTVRDYGHHATADELHNTMEAMVGVEYGMQTGIWWGTCEYSRSQFMKATTQHNPGKRLAYAEHRNNWTAASVYRLADGRVQAFGGTSERQAYETSYKFLSLDRPVWYNGELGREFLMTLPGGTGYQIGQTNAETVVDIQSGEDIMPHIDGTYKIVNVRSCMPMGFSAAPADKDSYGNAKWTSVSQRKDAKKVANYLQWVVKPVDSTIGGDFTYYSFTLNTGKNLVLDLLNWYLDSGGEVGSYTGGMGGNEQWYLEYAGNGAFYIRSRHSAMCLESMGKAINASIKLNAFTGEDSQKWRFLPVEGLADLVAPEAPTGLTATPQSASIRLDWTASSSSDVNTYVVLRSENGSDYYAIANQVTGTSFSDNIAQNGVTYSYRVYAVDNSLNYSEQTTPVTATVSGEADAVMVLEFEDNLYDATSNGNHAAIYGDAVWEEGKSGQKSIRLDGSQNFIQLPYTVANHDEITVACWVYWQGGNNWQRLWDFGTGTNQYMFLSPQCGSGMRFAIKNGGDEQQITADALADNTWAHVALTLGANGACLYVNGSLVGSNANVSIRPSEFSPYLNYVGRSQFASDPAFKGNIDDLRIYNYALTADEVKSVADGTDGIYLPNVTERVKGTESPSYSLSGRKTSDREKGILVKNGRTILKR